MSEIVTVVDLLDDSPDDVVLDDVQNTIVAELIWSEIKKIVNKLSRKCKYENKTKSMKQLFNSLIMPVYKELDENYKTSKSFEKVLSNTLRLLQNDPNHKFTHIKHLYETIKLHKVRKKVSFVTLAINLSDKNSEATKRKFDNNDNIVKKCKLDTIELDEDPSVTSKENKDCDVIILDDVTEENSQKENDFHVSTTISNDIENSDCSISTFNTVGDSNKVTKNLLAVDKNSLLVPRNADIFTEDSEHIDVEKKLKIENIEREIAIYKQQIVILEKKEVDDDTVTSPYVISNKYKAKIVKLYEELCKLTGTDSVKRREIRLTVNDGHPAGPVWRLERFMNNRIGRDGLPLFPDFNDVVNCVIISNQIDELGWSMSQIMREAKSLFTQCGRALQRRRQNREWRHLLATVEQRLEVDDPAEKDAQLEARLQQNRRIAMKKESDLLERFTMMQDLNPGFSRMNSKMNEVLRTVSKFSANSINNEELKESSNKYSMEKSLEAVYENSNNYGIVIVKSETLRESNIKDTIEESAGAVHENGISDGTATVKREKVDDVPEILPDLGENYTITVKHPSLVIEISSDSSSEED